MDPQNPVIPAKSANYLTTRSPLLKTEERNKSPLLEGITIKMTAKGKYYWDIQAYGKLDENLVLKVSEINKFLIREFPNNSTNEE